VDAGSTELPTADAASDDHEASDVTPDDSPDQSSEEGLDANAERPAKRRRRGRRGGRRRNQKPDSNNAESRSDELPANGASNGSVNEAGLSPPHAGAIQDISPPPSPAQAEPPATADAGGGMDNPATPSSEDQPRRGWWQRLIE
jgi:ribonuclease E